MEWLNNTFLKQNLSEYEARYEDNNQLKILCKLSCFK